MAHWSYLAFEIAANARTKGAKDKKKRKSKGRRKEVGFGEPTGPTMGPPDIQHFMPRAGGIVKRKSKGRKDFRDSPSDSLLGRRAPSETISSKTGVEKNYFEREASTKQVERQAKRIAGLAHLKTSRYAKPRQFL